LRLVVTADFSIGARVLYLLQADVLLDELAVEGLRTMLQTPLYSLLALFLAADLAGLAAPDQVSGPRGAQSIVGLDAQPFSADQSSPAKSAAMQAARNPRVLFITAKDSPRSDEELLRLRRAGGEFDKLRSAGWTIGAGPENHLQIVEREAIPELIEQLKVRDFPTVACVDHSQIVRSFTAGCTTPLDVWTFGFLAKGVDERPPGTVSEAARVETTGHYPLRGNHWSVDDDWSPSREKVVSHLRGPNHGHQIRAGWAIESWSYEELRSLHDNLHEIEMGGVSYSSRQQPSNQFSATRKAGGH
jgi:hypothetical protein